MLRGMTRVAFALAEDQYKLLESKVGTLSLILRRVYSDEGDAGLRRYFTDARSLGDLLEFSRHVRLDTPMLYPRRSSASTMKITKETYSWTTTFDQEEIDSYLTDLRQDLRDREAQLKAPEAPVPSDAMEVDAARALSPPATDPQADPMTVRPAEITISPVPSRVGSSFESPREPSPLVTRKHRRVEESEYEESSSEEEDEEDELEEVSAAEVQTPPPASPQAGPSRVAREPSPFDLLPPEAINPLIQPPSSSSQSRKEKRKLKKMKQRMVKKQKRS